MMPAKQKIVWFSWKDRMHPASGGAEVVADQLMKRLVADGHEVVLLTSAYPGAKHRDEHNGYKIIRSGNRYTVHLLAIRNFFRYLRGWPTLAIDECNTAPFFAGWYTGVPTVMVFHMLCRKIWFNELPQPFSSIGWLAEPIYLRLLKRGTVITVSESTKRDLIRNGFKGKDIHIISEGLELKPVKDLSTPKYDQPTVLSLGAMRSMKRTLDQVKAFEIAKKDIPNLRLMLAGDSSGAYGEQVLTYARESKFADDIHILGKVSQEKKLELQCRSHIFMVTSLKEGWGLVVTEANSQGTPAVAYGVDGLVDSIKDGETGMIAKAETPEALADTIVAILRTQPSYEKMRTAGYEWSKTMTFERSYSDFERAIQR